MSDLRPAAIAAKLRVIADRLDALPDAPLPLLRAPELEFRLSWYARPQTDDRVRAGVDLLGQAVLGINGSLGERHGNKSGIEREYAATSRAADPDVIVNITGVVTVPPQDLSASQARKRVAELETQNEYLQAELHRFRYPRGTAR